MIETPLVTWITADTSVDTRPGSWKFTQMLKRLSGATE